MGGKVTGCIGSKSLTKPHDPTSHNPKSRAHHGSAGAVAGHDKKIHSRNKCRSSAASNCSPTACRTRCLDSFRHRSPWLVMLTGACVTATLPVTMLAQTVVIFDTSPDNLPYHYIFVSVAGIIDVPDFTLYCRCHFFSAPKGPSDIDP